MASWGDASVLAPNGGTKVMPESLHGCFVDYEDNVWLAGNADGIVQKVPRTMAKLCCRLAPRGCATVSAPAATGSAHPPFFPTCTSPGSQQQQDAPEQPGRHRRGPESRPGHQGTGQRLHRRRIRQSPHRRLRQQRHVSAAVGLGGKRPGTVCGGGRRTSRTASSSATMASSTPATVAMPASRPSTGWAPCSASSRSSRRGFPISRFAPNDIAFSNDRAQTFFYTSDVGSGTSLDPASHAGSRGERNRRSWDITRGSSSESTRWPWTPMAISTSPRAEEAGAARNLSSNRAGLEQNRAPS